MLSSTLRTNVAGAFKPLLAPARYKGAYGGRGSGKSHYFAEQAVVRCIREPPQRIVCVREVQKALRESVKRLIEDKILALNVSSQFRITQDMIETPGGGLILFQGMQDHTAESIKSLEGFNVAYVEEAQSLTERSLEFLRPTIRAPGSELWFSWNPTRRDDPVDVLLRGPSPPEGAVVVRVNYDTNPFFPLELERERRDYLVRKPERYEHIWEGAYEPAAIGAYYAREMSEADRKGRITAVPHMPGLPVETWWDLGAAKVGRTMAVGFVQRVGHELHAIDFIDDDGPDKGLPYFAKVLQEKQAELKYVYSEHVWPHDGGHLQKATGETLAETFGKLMGKPPVVLERSDVAPGIDAVRNLLPLIWFDGERRARWVAALRYYRNEYDEDKKTFKDKPLADWATHGADMTRTGAMYVPHTGWPKLAYPVKNYA